MQKIFFLVGFLAFSLSAFAQNKMQLMGINPNSTLSSEPVSSISHRVNLDNDKTLILKDLDKKTAATTKVTKAAKTAYVATMPMNVAYTTTSTKRALWFRSKKK